MLCYCIAYTEWGICSSRVPIVESVQIVSCQVISHAAQGGGGEGAEGEGEG